MAKLNLPLMNFVYNFISIFSNNSTTEPFIINYYHTDHKIYSIERRENNFKILTKSIIYCFKAPCNPPVISINTITNEEDCQNLKSLFDKIFTDSEIKQKNVIKGKTPDEQIGIILKVLENNKIISKLEYEIINNLGEYNSNYRKRGYLDNIEGDSIIYTICMGQMYSGGYSIKVKEVKIEGDIATIYVEEKSPGKYEIVTDALTYPIIQVKFYQIPSRIKILNYDTGESFSRLN